MKFSGSVFCFRAGIPLLAARCAGFGQFLFPGQHGFIFRHSKKIGNKDFGRAYFDALLAFWALDRLPFLVFGKNIQLFGRWPGRGVHCQVISAILDKIPQNIRRGIPYLNIGFNQNTASCPGIDFVFTYYVECYSFC